MRPLSILMYLFVLLVAISMTAAAAATIADPWYNRVAYQDMDPIWDDDVESREHNMDNAVKHVVAQGVNTVYIQAYVDVDTHTNVKQMYYSTGQFGTPQGPRSGSNAFATFAAKFKKAGLMVGAWMPITAFRPTSVNGKTPEVTLVLDNTGNAVDQDCDTAAFYCKLALWNTDNRAWILQIYKDLLTAYPDLDLINFHDDGAFNQDTDVSPSALAAYGAAGFPSTAAGIFDLKTNKWNSVEMKNWALFKSQAISSLTASIMTELRKTRATLKSSRNYYANAFLAADEDSVRWFSQDCASALEHYDYIAPMIFPYMEQQTPDGTGVGKFDVYFEDAYTALKACNPDMKKIQLCLQSVDWRKAGSADYVVPFAEFEQWVRKGLELGFYHFGYYPSNHYSDATSPKTTTTLAALMAQENCTTACEDDDTQGGDDDGNSTMTASITITFALIPLFITIAL